MRTLANADYDYIVKVLALMREGKPLTPNQQRKINLIIKKQERKYGK